MDALSMPIHLLPLVWPLVITCLVMLAIPDLTRPGLFFGVTVEPQFPKSTQGRRIRGRYSIAVCLGSVVIGAIVIASSVASISAPASIKLSAPDRAVLIIALFQVAISVYAFVEANRATRPHATRPSPLVTVDLTTTQTQTTAITTAFVVPFISLIALGAWTTLQWDTLPSQFAVHWSFSGPDRWVRTTPTSVATLLLLNTAVCALCSLIAWGIFNGSRRIATSGEPAVRERRFRMRSVSLLLAAEYLAVFPSWVSLLDLPPVVIKVGLTIGGAAMLTLLARLLLSGQGGSHDLPSARGAPTGDRTADAYWRLGLIYFNRADPSFLVEKRFGVGYTFNFAHRFTWTILAVMAALPLIGRFLL